MSSPTIENHLVCRLSPNRSSPPRLGRTVSAKLVSFIRGSWLTNAFHPTDSSGADDEITMRENRSAYQRIWFRPRVLRDVTEVDYSSTILGHKVSPEKLEGRSCMRDVAILTLRAFPDIFADLYDSVRASLDLSNSADLLTLLTEPH